MLRITKETYNIIYDDRSIRAFVCPPESSWIDDFRADIKMCIEGLLIREAESISLGVAIKLNEDCDASEFNKRHGESRSEIGSILKDTRNEGKLSSQANLSRSKPDAISYLESYLGGLSEQEKQEALLICGIRTSDNVSRFTQFFSFDIWNRYQSDTDGRFIVQKDLLEERLKELAETPYTEVPFCAMCYSIGALYPRYVDYICPKCSSISVCKEDDIMVLERIRKIIPELKSVGYDIVLEEPEYCEQCRGNTPSKSLSYTFQIRFNPDDDYHVARTSDAYDFVCLHSFLMGGIGYHAYRDDEMLHDKIDTISKMTGLGADTVKQWSSKRWLKTSKKNDDYE